MSKCFFAAIAVLVFTTNAYADEANKSYSLQDVAKHSTEQDCWMAIEGKVYDLTAYIAKHPAGAGSMVGWCGQDAEPGMRTKEIGDDHSPEAWEELKTYLIGTLK